MRRDVAFVVVGVSEVLSQGHVSALCESVGHGASEGADGGGEFLVLFQLFGIDGEDLHDVIVGGDAMSSESVGESRGDGGDAAGELGRGDLALPCYAVGIDEVYGGPVGAAAGVDLLEFERGWRPPDFGGCHDRHIGILVVRIGLTLDPLLISPQSRGRVEFA